MTLMILCKGQASIRYASTQVWGQKCIIEDYYGDNTQNGYIL